ncbi:hypothetical protein [Frankia sp. AgB32]|uniref:hypothetical protein n=1 Tax=Frankia sp. AgB32 TaxID=631119 RepID=UPI00200DC1C5|nr:hypothetical protein [Frankia sp. AgB32]MCK9895762.1 hypothetical protein [Frankia sp. AgB32]
MPFERRLGPDGVADLLVRTESGVVVREQTRDYEASRTTHPQNHALPLRRARIETLVTPPQAAAGGTAFVVSGLDGTPLRFHVVGEDWAGQPVDLHMPLVFVPADDPADPAPLYQPVSTVELGGQGVALAPGDPVATVLSVQSFTFGAARGSATVPDPDGPGLVATAPASSALPFVTRAAVSIPAVDHLIGATATNPLPAAVVTLVDPATGAGDVFARLEGALPVDLPARQAGGLARPNVAIGALSRSLGAVPAGLDDLASIRSRLFAELGDARLPGSIRLDTVVGPITGFDQLPQVRQQVTPQGVEVTFTWSPPLQSAGPLVLRPGATLTLSSTLHATRGGGQPQSSVRGTLTNFAINFLDIVEEWCRACGPSHRPTRVHCRRPYPDLATHVPPRRRDRCHPAGVPRRSPRTPTG